MVARGFWIRSQGCYITGTGTGLLLEINRGMEGSDGGYSYGIG